MKLVISGLLVFMLSACASKQLPLQGKIVESTSNAKLNVSAEVVNDFSDEYNVLLQFNFQSKDGKWIRVDEAEVFFETSDKDPFNIVVGKDLVTWAESKAEEKKMDDYNKKTTTWAVAALGGAAAIAGILTDSKELAAVGAVTLGGASAYETYTKLKNNQKEMQGAKLVPEGHLYSPFAVPSMSLSKRWVLINCPNGRIGRFLKLRIKTIEGDSFTYNIDLVAKS